MSRDVDVDAELARIRQKREARENAIGRDETAGARQRFSGDFIRELPGLWAEDLESVPVQPREWIVHEMIPKGQVTGLYGPGGVGKDTILMQLAAAGIAGKKWFGAEVRAHRFLYVAVEDDIAELRRRQQAIGNHYGIRFSAHPRLWKMIPLGDQTWVKMNWPFDELGPVIGVFDRATGLVKPTRVFEALKVELEKFCPDVVILGNRVNIFAVDQNSDVQAQQCIRLLASLTTTNGRSVIMPAHPSRTGQNTGTGESGTVQWQNGVRSQLYFSRAARDGDDPDRDARVLTVKKANYGPEGLKLSSRWSDGVFILDGGRPPPARSAEEERRAEAEFLRLLDQYAAAGRRVSDAPSAPNNAACQFSNDATCAFKGRTGKGAMRAAMDRLLAMGTIETLEDGPPSKRRRRITRNRGAEILPTRLPTPFLPLPTTLSTLSPVPPGGYAPALEGGNTLGEGVVHGTPWL